MSEQKIDVRVVRLEPMRVACVNGYGKEPEAIAFNKMSVYVKAAGLDTDGKTHRFFGYNNPNPSAGSPNYGYDVWVTVDPETQPEEGVNMIDFPGGLYAVTSISPQTGEEIPGAWQSLVAWRENSRYRSSNHQWLEEHIGDIEKSFPDLTLDLYLPIGE